MKTIIKNLLVVFFLAAIFMPVVFLVYKDSGLLPAGFVFVVSVTAITALAYSKDYMKTMMMEAIHAMLIRLDSKEGKTAINDLQSMASRFGKTGCSRKESVAVVEAIKNFEEAKMNLAMAIDALARSIGE